MITANYQGNCRKVDVIKKTAPLCLIPGVEFSLCGEFSV